MAAKITKNETPRRIAVFCLLLLIDQEKKLNIMKTRSASLYILFGAVAHRTLNGVITHMLPHCKSDLAVDRIVDTCEYTRVRGIL